MIVQIKYKNGKTHQIYDVKETKLNSSMRAYSFVGDEWTHVVNFDAVEFITVADDTSENWPSE